MTAQVTISRRAADDLYTTDEYLSLTGGAWHLEDSDFKAKYAAAMAEKHALRPKTVCEIGCGAGGILRSLQERWQGETEFVGYEISEQAIELGRQFVGPRLRFVCGDAFADSATYDLALVMDVVEHVEDCFAFLRSVRGKGVHKMYHFPIEITCTSALRDLYGKGYSLGHIHHFSVSSALAALEHTGHRVVDWSLTPGAFECAKRPRTRLMNGLRRILPPKLATRLVGGYSLLVLAT